MRIRVRTGRFLVVSSLCERVVGLETAKHADHVRSHELIVESKAATPRLGERWPPCQGQFLIHLQAVDAPRRGCGRGVSAAAASPLPCGRQEETPAATGANKAKLSCLIRAP